MFKEPTLNFLPKRPSQAGYGIGLIGAGYIAEIAHIPAYQKAGYRLLAAADPSEERRQYCRKVAGVTKLFADHRALLDLPEVEIVDITIPQSSPHKMPVVHDAIDAGKHILLQKPFAMNYRDAVEVVEHAQRAGVKLALNHQRRWAPAYLAVKGMIDQGRLGDLFFLTVDERREYDWPGKSYIEQERMLLLMDGTHYVDLFRWLTGCEIKQVYASISRRPGQHARGEMVGTLLLDFDTNLRAVYITSLAGYRQAEYQRFRLEGTEGVISGNYDNSWGPGEFEYSPARSESLWFRPQLTGSWIPDAFIGSMGDLMEAIASDREPAVSGADNLKTLQVIFAAYRSAELARSVAPAEISAETALAR